MQRIFLLIILFFSIEASGSIKYFMFEGKWQEEYRTYGKRKDRITDSNAVNSLKLEFYEEGVCKRYYNNGIILPGHIQVSKKSILFYVEQANTDKQVLEKTYSSFGINDQLLLLETKDTVITLRRVEQFKFNEIKKTFNNEKEGDVNIDLATLKGSWKRYKTEPTIVLDKEAWSLFRLTVEYSVAKNRYLGKAQFASVNQGQHACDVTITPLQSKNEFIVTEEATDDVVPLDLKLKFKVLKCDSREMVLRQGDMTCWYIRVE